MNERVEADVASSPWITIKQAAAYAQCGVKLLYGEIRRGRLRATPIGGRRELRLTRAWLDEWLERLAPSKAA